MDIGTLATGAVSFLAAYLPALLNKASEKAGEKAGEEDWEKAKEIWSNLLTGGDDLITLNLAEKVADKPEDSTARTMLELQLKTLLERNTRLAVQVERLLKEAESEQQGDQVTVNVEKGVGVGVNKGHMDIKQDFHN